MKKFATSNLTLAVVLVLLFASCEHKKIGVKKDLATGLVTSYKGMEPAQTLLVMNDEVLNHTDIPIGEKFIVINDDVSGLVTENGKVKVG